METLFSSQVNIGFVCVDERLKVARAWDMLATLPSPVVIMGQFVLKKWGDCSLRLHRCS